MLQTFPIENLANRCISYNWPKVAAVVVVVVVVVIVVGFHATKITFIIPKETVLFIMSLIYSVLNDAICCT
jgi:hypothetical protein